MTHVSQEKSTCIRTTALAVLMLTVMLSGIGATRAQTTADVAGTPEDVRPALDFVGDGSAPGPQPSVVEPGQHPGEGDARYTDPLAAVGVSDPSCGQQVLGLVTAWWQAAKDAVRSVWFRAHETLFARN